MPEINPFKEQDILSQPIPDGTESRFGSDVFKDVKSLQVGVGSKVLRADKSGLWLGAATFADAPFSVDMDGNVTATSITLTGYIPTGGAASDVNGAGGLDAISNGSTYFRTTANQVTGATRAFGGLDSASGIIKGFLASALSAVSLPTTGVRIDQNGIYGRASGVTTFWIDATTGSANFAGTLLAASGTFGTITAGTLSGQSISGSTITGGTVQTNSSGLRTVLDGSTDSIKFMNSSTTYSQIYPYVFPQGNGIYIETGSSKGSGDAFCYVYEGSHAGAGIGTNLASIDFYDNEVEINSSTTTINSSTTTLLGKLVLNSITQPYIYFGYCSGTVVSSTNTSFTLSNPSTGKYTLTHNFTTTAYIVVATALRASGAGAYQVKIEARNSNSVQFTVFDDVGTVQNGDFMFTLCKVA